MTVPYRLMINRVLFFKSFCSPESSEVPLYPHDPDQRAVADTSSSQTTGATEDGQFQVRWHGSDDTVIICIQLYKVRTLIK